MCLFFWICLTRFQVDDSTRVATSGTALQNSFRMQLSQALFLGKPWENRDSMRQLHRLQMPVLSYLSCFLFSFWDVHKLHQIAIFPYLSDIFRYIPIWSHAKWLQIRHRSRSWVHPAFLTLSSSSCPCWICVGCRKTMENAQLLCNSQHLPSISPASLSLHGSEIPASWDMHQLSESAQWSQWLNLKTSLIHWSSRALSELLNSRHPSCWIHVISYLILPYIVIYHLSSSITSAFCSSAAQVLFMMWTRRVLWLLRLRRFLVLLVVLLWTCTLDQSRHVLTRAPRSAVKHSQTSLHTALRLEMAWVFHARLPQAPVCHILQLHTATNCDTSRSSRMLLYKLVLQARPAFYI